MLARNFVINLKHTPLKTGLEQLSRRCEKALKPRTFTASSILMTAEQINNEIEREAGKMKKVRNKRYYEKNREKLVEKQRAYRKRMREEREGDRTEIQTVIEMKAKRSESEEKEMLRKEITREMRRREKKRERQKRYYQRHLKERSECNRLQYQRKKEQDRESYLMALKDEELRENVKADLERGLRISSLEDWYTITRKKLHNLRWACETTKNITKTLDLSEMLGVLYPEREWRSDFLKIVPTSTWRQQEKTRQFVLALEPALFIESREDWYHVSIKQLRRVGGGGCLAFFENRLVVFLYDSDSLRIINMLEFAFPESYWDPRRFSNRGKKSSQRWLSKKTSEVFPKLKVLNDYVYYDETQQRRFEIDVWIPEENLGFEYQGEHHFRQFSSWIGGAPADFVRQSQRDQAKRDVCSKAKIKLLEVPYWWDESKASLESLITEDFPDAFLSSKQE